MKIIKIKNCGRKCEYFVIVRLLLMNFFECSHPVAQIGNVNKRMTDEDLKEDFPYWCPLEDYKEAGHKGSWETAADMKSDMSAF